MKPNKGHENLISLGDRPIEERREIARKGGITTGKNAAHKRLLRETIEAILALPVNNKADRDFLKKLGISSKDMTKQTLIMSAIVNLAQEGNVNAAIFIRDTLGQKEVERIEMVNPIQIVVEDDYGNQLTPVPPVKQIPSRDKK